MACARGTAEPTPPPQTAAPGRTTAGPAPTPSPPPRAGHPFAVVLDNAPAARPQAGLDQADVVYEAPAEAGIPRLLALFFANTEAERIGPVRSARDYFVYLAAEYHVPLVHIGASPQGFAALEETHLERVDEARGDGGFVRDPSRPAPHDAFVTTASVRTELAHRRIAVSPTTAGLDYGPFQPGTRPATHLRIAYPSSAGYVVQYDYDAQSKTYRRAAGGWSETASKSSRPPAARAMIIQFVQIRPIADDPAGRVDIELLGIGTGVLLAEGTQIPLRWSKADVGDPTRFHRDDGATFALPDGPVWIQLVPLDAQVEVS